METRTRAVEAEVAGDKKGLHDSNEEMTLPWDRREDSKTPP